MPISDDRLLSILVCPEDRQSLLYFADEDAMYNPRLHRRYRIIGGVPELLIDAAETVSPSEHERLVAKGGVATGGAGAASAPDAPTPAKKAPEKKAPAKKAPAKRTQKKAPPKKAVPKKGSAEEPVADTPAESPPPGTDAD
ncbi:MAG: hypothetical protein R2698_01690 [Microthrixaceae bacterium]